ncbi:MAG: hypothetical protein EOP81_09930 [Variovorax sp.]|nr:MAG: hypothetical protein EOP81_09930 [Variovorax sp.]
MSFQLTEAQQRFRDEVRAFIAARLSPATSRKVLEGYTLERDDYVQWHHALHAHGWGTPPWPAEHGGPGWDAVQRHIFEEETALAGAPELVPFGYKMVAPVLMRYGSPAQRDYFLPRIASLEHWWSQGYSEPGAGSDLASLRTRAERRGEHYVVNGQKVWNTHGQYADWIFCLVRTRSDGRPQEGISFMLIDLRSPGVEVRPIITLDGAHEVNEVWFHNVQVPVENLVGQENHGWTYAKFLLAHERANFGTMMGGCRRDLARLRRLAAEEPCGARPLLHDPLFAARLARLEAELVTIETVNMRLLTSDSATDAHSASFLKIMTSELQQAIADLSLQAGGLGSLVFDRNALTDGGLNGDARGSRCAPLAATYLNMRKTTIYGGSNEIQKNITARLLLDAPQGRAPEPGFDTEQQMLQDMLARYLRDAALPECLPDAIDADRERTHWQGLAALGVTSLLAPEQAEALGGGTTEAMLVLRELGRAGASTPYLPHAVLATLALRAAPDDGAHAWLRRMHEGEEGALVTLALDEAQTRYDWHAPQATFQAQGCQMAFSGTKTGVPYGSGAAAVVVSAQQGGELALFVLPVGLATCTRQYRGLDGTPLADLALPAATDQAMLLARGEAAHALVERLRGWQIAGLAALGVGALQTVCEMTANYLSERRQFGQALSQFQVLRHRFIDMRIHLLKAEAMAALAAEWAVRADSAERRNSLASAKLALAEAATFVAEQAVQLHGAIGMTAEYALGRYVRLLTTVRLQGGDADAQLRVLGGQS